MIRKEETIKNIISITKNWQLNEPEVIDEQMAIEHMTAFVEAIEYESYSKKDCQHMAEVSISKFLHNRDLFFTVNIDNNIAVVLARRYTDSFIRLLKQLDTKLSEEVKDLFYENEEPIIELSYGIKFYKKDGLYVTNMQKKLQQYINTNILYCHNYTALINRTDIKAIYSEEILPQSSNAIIRLLRKIFGMKSKWHYYINDDKLLRDHTISKAVCDDFYNTGYIQALADEFRQQLLKKVENYFQKRGE